MAEHPYRTENRPPNEREDEALAELSRRVVRARAALAAGSIVLGLCAGVTIYLAVDTLVVAHYPYYTMLAAMVIALGAAIRGGRWLGRRWVAMRMPQWIPELAARYAIEPARLVELSSIWS